MATMETRHFNCKFTIEQEKQIVEEYLAMPISNATEMAKRYNVGVKAIKGALHRQDIKISARAFDESGDKEVSKLYNSGYSLLDLSHHYRLSQKAILNSLNRTNTKRRPNRTYFFNENAFDNLDSELPLYWAGFAYADGNVTHRTLRFGLSSKDKSHLIKLKEFMGSKTRIVERPGRSDVEFNSVYLVARLSSIGFVVKRGKFNLLEPEIPQHLASHFILGYLDGDGCISTNEQVVFLGQVDILKWIRTTLHNEVGASNNSIRPRRGIHEISWGGYNQACKIVDWLYRDATIWLDRKRKIAENWRK